MRKTIIPLVLAGLLTCPSMAYAADSANEDPEAQTAEQPAYGDGYSDFTYNNGWSGDVTDETQWDGVEHAHLGVMDYPSQPGDTYEHNLPGETQEYVERSQDGMTFWSDGSSIGARIDETPANDEGWDNWQCMSSGNANFWWADGNGDGQIDYVTHDCYGWNNPPAPVEPDPEPEPEPDPDPQPADPSEEPSQPAEEPSDPAPVPEDTETGEPAEEPATETADNGTPTENSTAPTTTEEATNDTADTAQPAQPSSEPAPGVDAGTPSPEARDTESAAGSAAAAGQSVPTQGTMTQGPRHRYEPRHRMPVTGATIADDVFFGILVLVGGAVVLKFRRKNDKED